MKGKVKGCGSLGVTLTLLALGATVIAFATDEWVWITHKESNVTSEEVEDLRHEYHERHYGILKECFPLNAKWPSDLTGQKVTKRDSILGTQCFYIDYHIPPKKGVEYRSHEWTRIHMMRATFGLLVSGIFLLFIVALLGVYSCCMISASLHRWIITLLVLAGFLIGAAVAFFHAKLILEQEQISESSVFYKDRISESSELYEEVKKDKYFEKTVEIFSKGLKNTKPEMELSYYWSYMLAWIGCGLSWLAAIFFYLGGRGAQKMKKILETYPAPSTSSMMPLEYAQYPMKSPYMIPPEDYYQDPAPEYILEDRRQRFLPPMPQHQMMQQQMMQQQMMPPPSAPYEVLEEFYTPDGKLVAAAPAAAAAAATPATTENLAQYSDPRLMKKY